MSDSKAEAFEEIKARYMAYYNTADPDGKGHFYSDGCMQICGPQPTYAAKNGATIVAFLKEGIKSGTSMNNKREDGPKPGCTIRLLRDDERVFETDEVVAHIDTTSAALRERAETEGWVGTRVDMWFPMGDGEMLVKVQYWWRKEGGEWKQILHDIMYMGPRDGTEGTEGERIA